MQSIDTPMHGMAIVYSIASCSEEPTAQKHMFTIMGLVLHACACTSVSSAMLSSLRNLHLHAIMVVIIPQNGMAYSGTLFSGIPDDATCFKFIKFIGDFFV